MSTFAHTCTSMSKLMLVCFTLFRNLRSPSNRWRRNCRQCNSKCVLVPIVLTMLNKENIWLNGSWIHGPQCEIFLIFSYSAFLLGCFMWFIQNYRNRNRTANIRLFDGIWNHWNHRSSVPHGSVMLFQVSCCDVDLTMILNSLCITIISNTHHTSSATSIDHFHSRSCHQTTQQPRQEHSPRQENASVMLPPRPMVH